MIILAIPRLTKPIVYIEFYNLSGLCELRVKKYKINEMSYDRILKYLRSSKRGLKDAYNITALLDYKTGSVISDIIPSQFTIIRHQLRKLLLDDINEDNYNLYTNKDNKILFDDRDFIIKYNVSVGIGIIPSFYLNISKRLKLDETIVALVINNILWSNYSSIERAEVFNTFNNKQVLLKINYLYDIYEFLPYEMQIDNDIVNCMCDQLLPIINDRTSDHLYKSIIETIHPDALNSDLLRKYVPIDILVELYEHIPKEKLDEDILISIRSELERIRSHKF